jgi:hypothetical protein
MRLNRAAVGDGHYDRRRSIAEYARVFEEYGIDVLALDSHEAASMIQGSVIRDHLVAGLEAWAFTLLAFKEERTAGAVARARQLLQLAAEVESDEWRNRLRTVVLEGSDRDLETLVESALPTHLQLPAATFGMLGQLVANQAKPSEKMVDFLRRAQRGSPSDFWINHYLASSLSTLGAARLDEAIGYYRAALAIRPESPEARYNLGIALRDIGRLDDAEAEFLTYKNSIVPAVCPFIEVSSGPYARATPDRYKDACAAALAGCGQGKDADQTDSNARAHLRRKALDWLRADLAAWRQLLERDPDKVRPVVVQSMQSWLADKDFAGVRGEALAKLPEAERQEWQTLWREVEALRQRSSESANKTVN